MVQRVTVLRIPLHPRPIKSELLEIGPSVFQAPQVIPIHSQTKPTSLKQCFWKFNMQRTHLGNLVCRPEILHFWRFLKKYSWSEDHILSVPGFRGIRGGGGILTQASVNSYVNTCVRMGSMWGGSIRIIRVLFNILCSQESTACPSYA